MHLYHYCSLNTFEIIAKNKTLRLSDITRSNDSMELRYAINLIDDSLEAAYKSETTKFFRDKIDNEAFKRIKERLISVLKNMSMSSTCYVLCFSQEPDLLSQWRGYAADGKGVSIGLDKDRLSKYARDNNMILNQVVYNKMTQKSKLRAISNKIIKDIKATIKTINDQIQLSDKIELLLQEYEKEFFKCMVIMKDGFFKEEKEWRICCYNSSKDEITDYFFGEDGCKSFIEIKLDDIIKNSNLDIRLGPKNNSNISDIEKFLEKNQILCSVKKSKGTYR